MISLSSQTEHKWLLRRPSAFGWLAVLAVFAIWGCQSASTSITSANTGEAPVALSFRRGMCFGPCPAFDLTWYVDGAADLTVIRPFADLPEGVLAPGSHHLPASRAGVRALTEVLDLASNLNFDSHAGTYDNPMITDLPTRTLTIGATTVVDRYQGPPIGPLYDAIDAWIKGQTWTTKQIENQFK